jgi:hypothetical protein
VGALRQVDGVIPADEVGFVGRHFCKLLYKCDCKISDKRESI